MRVADFLRIPMVAGEKVEKIVGDGHLEMDLLAEELFLFIGEIVHGQFVG